MNFFLSDEGSIAKIFEYFELYKMATGANLNHEKTQILKLGNPAISNFEHYVTTKIKIYGIVFNDQGFDKKGSFDKAEKNIQKLLCLNAHSEFSLESRSIFISTYFLSKFWYCALFINPPEELVQLTNKAIVRFLWAQNERCHYKKLQ